MMNGNAAMDYRNPSVVRKLGIEALTKELGAVGMASFIRQYDRGAGNYTRERNAWLDGMTLDDVKRELGTHE